MEEKKMTSTQIKEFLEKPEVLEYLKKHIDIDLDPYGECITVTVSLNKHLLGENSHGW